MTDIADLERILEWMRAAGLSHVTISEAGENLMLELPAVPAPAGTNMGMVAPAEPGTNLVVTSPAIGRFQLSHPAGTSQTLEIGTPIAANQILGFLVLGLTITAIRAPRDGRIAEGPPADGTLVGLGTPLITLS